MAARVSSQGFWILLLSLALVRGLVYGAIVPPWQAPDEPQHFEHVRLVQRYGRAISRADLSQDIRNQISSSMQLHQFWLFAPMPTKPRTTTDVPAAMQAYWEKSHGEFHQPFLYYWLQAQLLRASSVADTTVQLYLSRFISSVMGGAVVLLTYLAVRTLFPSDDFLHVTVPSLVLFLPMYTHLSSAVNNDNLAVLCATTVLFLVTLLVADGVTLTRVLLLAAAIVAGIYSKTTFLFVIPVAALGMLIAIGLRLSKHARQLAVGFSAVLTVIAILLVSFMPTGLLSIMKRIPALRLAMGFPVSLPEMIRVLEDRWILYAKSMFVGFWGSFGWYSLQLSVWLYWLLAVVGLAAVVGLGCFIVRTTKRYVEVEVAQMSILLLYAVAFALALNLTVARFLSANVAWAEYGYNVSTLPQGRFLFPVILGVGTLFMVGIRELVPERHRGIGALAVAACMVLLDSIALLGFIIPYYYGRVG